ncbi:DUF4283 domain protein [Medicago truncatula]|uniref:DUF4283 domain protein n=1 Tax=Medicago truncatula TaxID=3880 RepID=G7L338_MEDTR|nr:DUF4283 domain protein [Medicago truncatula]
MARAWKSGKRVLMVKTDGDRFLFQFHHKMNAACILDDGPWLYDNFHIVMDSIHPSVVPISVDLNHLDIWVQVHGLPFGCIQPNVGDELILGAKERGLGADSGQKYEMWDKNMSFPKSERWPGPCSHWYGRAKLQSSLLLLLLRKQATCFDQKARGFL